ncbi:MAG: FCSD flavin-binding domain-containing protein [Alphaproteobacteria bacterium]
MRPTSGAGVSLEFAAFRLRIAVMGSGGVSPLDAPDSERQAEYDFAAGWYRSVTEEMFG